MQSREQEYKKLLLSIIEKKLPHCKVYLFGSRARGGFLPGADFDLAIDAGNRLDMGIIYSIQDMIEESILPVFVDIVDVHNVSKEFLDEIKRDWIVWKS